MNSIRTFGAAALVSAASLTAANAADLPSHYPPPPPPPLPVIAGWDGVYVGTTYGYQWTNVHTTQDTSRSRSINGQSGGGLIGYAFQSGHFVFGPEASIDLNVVRGTIPGQPGLSPSRFDTLDDVRLRGVLGYEFGWFMPFIAGGAVINEAYQSTPNPDNYFGRDKRRVGWTAGGGVEFKINPSQYLNFLPMNLGSIFGPLIFRVEYIHDSISAENFILGGGTVVPPIEEFRTRSSSNIVRAAAIYRFGDTPPQPYADSLGNVNWSGGYGGLMGAYDSVNFKTKLSGFNSTKGDASGGFGGIYAGTNFMFLQNRVMLGIEGSTMLGDATGKSTTPGLGSDTSFREYVRADLRGRVGYAYGSFLPFLAAGVDFTRNEQRDIQTGSQEGRIPVDAFSLGGGLDYRISQRVSVRAEYVHDFGFNKSKDNLDGLQFKQDYDANLARFGIAYHFE